MLRLGTKALSNHCDQIKFFLKFFVTISNNRNPIVLLHFGLFKNHFLSKIFCRLATFGIIWATYSFSIWSHCFQQKKNNKPPSLSSDDAWASCAPLDTKHWYIP